MRKRRDKGQGVVGLVCGLTKQGLPTDTNDRIKQERSRRCLTDKRQGRLLRPRDSLKTSTKTWYVFT